MINIDSKDEATKLKVTWNYLKNQENPIVLSESVKILNPKKYKLLNYTLAIKRNNKNGLPPGKYELIIAPETKNAKPIYRKFTVK